MKFRLVFIYILFLLFINSCKKDNPIVDNAEKYGKISFQFTHNVDGQALIVDTLVYTNAAGNEYMINEVQYFISDVVLHNSKGTFVTINQSNGIHYVDSDLSSTMSWNISDDIPEGNYTSVSFTFGINETKNQSYIYQNPPERDMFWPEFLGGGYHYLKLNGKWKDTNDNISPFNFHLGIGQIYAHDTIVVDSIIGFVQNYFTINLPNSSFTIAEKQTTNIEIIMNIESWFETPNIWDFDYWGGNIMQNQPAMNTAKENGADVFTVGIIQ